VCYTGMLLGVWYDILTPSLEFSAAFVISVLLEVFNHDFEKDWSTSISFKSPMVLLAFPPSFLRIGHCLSFGVIDVNNVYRRSFGI